MPLNTHYSKRLTTAIEKLNKIAPKKFYEIFNNYGLFDVDDENNGLTPEQRESVREDQRKFYTTLSNIINDILFWYLGDNDKGLVTRSVQDIVDKLDVRASSNAAKVDVMGSAISAVPVYGAAINAAQKVAGAQVAAVMGTSIFDPDLIPPINFGMDFSLPGNVANIYKNGFFQPNWEFLYNFEYKNPKFYFTGSGGLKIGTGVDVGSSVSELWLKRIFNVSTVSKDLLPIGDPVSGVTADDYNTILKARGYGVANAGKNPGIGLNDEDIKNFSLTDEQMRGIFYKLVDLNLWQPINNPKNWASSHWGALGHNSCPTFVRTAVASYIWDVGMAIEDKKSVESAFISYCLQMGLYYLTGFNYKVRMVGIEDVNIVPDGQTINIGEDKIIQGIPKNKKIANTYFTWIADILVRTTHNINGDVIALDKRKRRIAEANLIYAGVGLPVIEFGKPVSELPYIHTTQGLRDRNFDKLVSKTIYRYANEGSPGGVGENHSLKEPQKSSVNIIYGENVNRDTITEYSINVIKKIFASAGINTLTITSAGRTAREQARIMFQNLENGNRISYKAPGQEVVNVYDTEKTSGSSDATIKNKMENKIVNLYPRLVSRHTVADTNVVNVIDISPTTLKPANKTQFVEQILRDNTGPGKLIEQLLGPRPDMGNDPAYHLVIPQNAADVSEYVNDALPDVAYSLQKNPNFIGDAGFIAPLAKDRILMDDFEQAS